MDVRDPLAAELGKQALSKRGLVASDDARLVAVARAVPDRSRAHALEPRRRSLAQRQLARRAHRAAADRGLRLGAPGLRFGEGRERLLDPPLVTLAPDARLVRRPAVAATVRVRLALLQVSHGDADVSRHDLTLAPVGQSVGQSNCPTRRLRADRQRNNTRVAGHGRSLTKFLQRAMFFWSGAA